MSGEAGYTRLAEDVTLSVVVPVYNLAGSIVQNVTVIRDRVAVGVDGAIEVIVVSDGSVDRTDEALLEGRLDRVRLLHYDRNLGKGYAVKVGALEAKGRWVAYCDADLDLDPGLLPGYVAEAERDGLDFAIGSKRHPRSQVRYPRSRRVSSWLFQQVVRLLFRLQVKDTQTGLKVFRREIAEQVVPLLLVKRYAFDIELLAVARAFGFARLREMPVKLDYRFTGSGVRSRAVLAALVDTAAIFYRLRVLKTYQRKRALFGAFGWTRPGGYAPLVTVVAREPDALRRLDTAGLRVELARTAEDRRRVASESTSELLVFVEDGGVVSANFLTATVPFFARGEVAAVVVSKVAPTSGTARERAAAAIRESRFGGGSQYYRFMPGNIRYVRDFRSATYIVRREAYLRLPDDVSAEDVPEAIDLAGERVVYTPEAFVVASAAPLFLPHLRNAVAYGRARAAMMVRRGPAAVRRSTAAAVAVAGLVALGWLLVFAGRGWLAIWAAVVALYLALVLVQAALAGIQHGSAAIGGLVAVGLVLTHAAYLGGLVTGLVSGRRLAGIREPRDRRG